MKKYLTFIVAVSLLLTSLPARIWAGRATPNALYEQNGSFILENSYIRIELDMDTGFLRSVQNVATGTVCKDDPEGAWPFSMKVGEQRDDAGIFTWGSTLISSVEQTRSADMVSLTVRYDNIINENTGESTGIRAAVTYTLGPYDDYIKFSVTIDNTEGTDIHVLNLCSGGMLMGGKEPEKEQLVLPANGGGLKWDNPRGNPMFQSGVQLGYPGTNQYSLEMGWATIQDETEGIGIAYINKQMTTVDFTIQSGTQGSSLSVTLLEPKSILPITVPIRAGETFSSDEVIVAAYQGDWHRFADIYRYEFEKAFTNDDGTPDYLTWDTLSEKVKNTDVMFRYIVDINGELRIDFDSLYQNLWTKANRWYGDLPAPFTRVMVWLSGVNEGGYGPDVPLTLPGSIKAGGTPKLQRLLSNIHNLGGNCFLYEHPFAFDPESSAYIPEADPFQSTEFWEGHNHNKLCIDNEMVQALWKDTILPQLVTAGADGVQFDQGSIQQTVCDLPGHNHNESALSRLSSHSHGMIALEKMIRAGLGENGYIVNECMTDYTSRYIDMRATAYYRKPIYGGTYITSLREYVFPYYVNHYDAIMWSGENQWDSILLQCGIMGGVVCLNDGNVSYKERDEYIRFKTAIREAQAPGYPFGFRDTVGITTSDPSIVAKAFTDGKNVTITYMGQNKDTIGTITVDTAKLGIPDGKVYTITVDSRNLKADFVVLD